MMLTIFKNYIAFFVRLPLLTSEVWSWHPKAIKKTYSIILIIKTFWDYYSSTIPLLGNSPENIPGFASKEME